MNIDYDLKTKNVNGISYICDVPGLVSLWDFNPGDPLLSKGKYANKLQPSGREIKLEQIGPLSGNAIRLKEGEYLFIPREQSKGLNIHGEDAQVTVCAWIRREQKSFDQCEAIAGMWNETNKKRQYCLFLNISLFESGDQVCGHISSIGAATPGSKWCTDVSIGKTRVPFNEWQFIAFTYDAEFIRSYLNGKFDYRAACNPYHYPDGIYDGNGDGSDFTVGAVHRLGAMGNNFVGLIGGLAVFNRALSAIEMADIYTNTNNTKK